MEIVNAHVHLIELDRMMERGRGFALPSGIAVFEEYRESLHLLSEDELLRQMDEAGIDRSILFAVDAPIVYASNEYVHAVCRRHPDRLLGFASVRPQAPDAVETFERAVQGLGMRGLKLHPPLQDFYPNDEAVYPLYEKAVALDVPVVFHVGTTPFGSLCRLDQANPLLLDEVAVAFPEMRILLTHLGTLWHQVALMVVEKNPNVFIDTAAYLYEIREIMTPETVARVGADRFIFGTDYPTPYVGQVHRLADFVDTVRGLPLPAETIEAILGRNVELLLNGRPDRGPGMSAETVIEEAARYIRREPETT